MEDEGIRYTCTTNAVSTIAISWRQDFFRLPAVTPGAGSDACTGAESWSAATDSVCHILWREFGRQAGPAYGRRRHGRRRPPARVRVTTEAASGSADMA